MTPKEKAIELYNKFLNPSGDTYLYGMLEHESAIECALIAVSELILENLRYDYIPFEGSRTEFYLKVQKELYKL